VARALQFYIPKSDSNEANDRDCWGRIKPNSCL